MRQYSETYHVLEVRKLITKDIYDVWHKPCDGMFRPAELLAYQGRLIEAIETAEKVQLEKHGHMLGHQFRCVTRTTTTTTLAGAMEDSQMKIATY
jgi:hypothetical protein